MKENDTHGWYLEQAGEITGPYTVHQLTAMWRIGRVHLGDRICREGTESWVTTRNFLEHLDGPASSDPVAAEIRHLRYTILAIAAGPLGIHNFSAKEFTEFLLKLGILILTPFIYNQSPGGAWVILGIVWIWALIEAAKGPSSSPAEPT